MHGEGSCVLGEQRRGGQVRVAVVGQADFVRGYSRRFCQFLSLCMLCFLLKGKEILLLSG